MKHTYILLLLALLMPLQTAKAETLSLETIVQRALQNSPDTARILNDVANIKAEAFEIEALKNPTTEINVTTIENDASRSIDVEFEQTLRLSDFGARQSYAEALRKIANIEEKVKILELIHSITRSYAAYWELQEQERILSENATYAHTKQKLIERAAKEGRVDVADAKIFKAEALRLEEKLSVIRTKKTSGAVNLLRMAGIPQISFQVKRPAPPKIPDLVYLTSLADNEGSIRNLLQNRKHLADKRYKVALQDSGFSEFSPRTVIDHDLDENNTTISFGINIAIPIWDRNNAELSRAIAEKNLTQSHIKALDEHTFANVLAASYEQAKTTQTVARSYQNKIVPSWRDVQNLMDAKFENGQATILDVFQMRERITSVKQEAIQAHLTSINTLIELEGLIGQTLTIMEN